MRTGALHSQAHALGKSEVAEPFRGAPRSYTPNSYARSLPLGLLSLISGAAWNVSIIRAVPASASTLLLLLERGIESDGCWAGRTLLMTRMAPPAAPATARSARCRSIMRFSQTGLGAGAVVTELWPWRAGQSADRRGRGSGAVAGRGGPIYRGPFSREIP